MASQQHKKSLEVLVINPSEDLQLFFHMSSFGHFSFLLTVRRNSTERPELPEIIEAAFDWHEKSCDLKSLLLYGRGKCRPLYQDCSLNNEIVDTAAVRLSWRQVAPVLGRVRWGQHLPSGREKEGGGGGGGIVDRSQNKRTPGSIPEVCRQVDLLSLSGRRERDSHQWKGGDDPNTVILDAHVGRWQMAAGIGLSHRACLHTGGADTVWSELIELNSHKSHLVVSSGAFYRITFNFANKGKWKTADENVIESSRAVLRLGVRTLKYVKG